MDLPDDAKTLWDAARALNETALARLGRAVSRTLPPLLFMTDPGRTPEPWTTAAVLPVGACVVFRHFGASDSEVTARRLREVTHDQGLLLLIGRDADLAERIRADGVHLPERDLAQAADLRRRRPDWLLTGAVHGGLTAAAETLDALVLSPVFTAGGGSVVRLPLGVGAFGQAVLRTTTPVYALGGITPANVGQLSNSGACGIASVEAIRKAFGPSA